jgi:hypothetical protein
MRTRRKGDKRLITLRGILLPVDWDERGRIVAVGLSGIDEKEYVIQLTEKKEELLNLLKREVEVTGELRNGAGSNILILRHFKVL